MLLFFAPDILTVPTLPESESLHCVRVLRKQAGDLLTVTDGRGNFFQTRIEDANPKACRVGIVAQTAVDPLPYRVEMAIAPTKNAERMDWLVEKATEIGVERITFLRTRFSERKDLKTDRLRKIVIAAMKQSEKAFLPEVSAMTDFLTFIRQPFDGQKFIAHCYEGDKPLLSHICRPQTDTLLLIGPEGDFSKEEVAAAHACGFQAVSLGTMRLRTETAALNVCQTIHIINQLHYDAAH